ncbi:MAG: hypothetical protein V8S92_07455 [Oscillospiraceae bacterium]
MGSLESTSFDYDTVTVEGPESVVSTISCAQIVMSRTNVDKNITESVDYTLVGTPTATRSTRRT